MSLQHAYRGGSENRPGWWFAFTYSEHKIEALKATIPPTERSWNEDKKEWWVSDKCLPQVLRVFPALEAYMKQAPLL